MFANLVSAISNAMYGYILIIVLVLGGLWFTFRSRFAQFRLLGAQLKAVTEKPKDGKGVSSFQALMVSTASRVGTGNIIGVSTAICLGGFGSVFWMWIIALVGAGSAFVESTLAQIFIRHIKALPPLRLLGNGVAQGQAMVGSAGVRTLCAGALVSRPEEAPSSWVLSNLCWR